MHLEIVAEVALAARQGEAAARLFGAEANLRATEGVFRDAWGVAETERIVSRARSALGQVAFETAFAAGAALTPADACAEADVVLAAIASRTTETAPGDQSCPGGLSPREVEVLCLVAAGRSNQQIADALFVGHRTAATHVHNILTKLDVDSRTAAAAWAIHHDLA